LIGGLPKRDDSRSLEVDQRLGEAVKQAATYLEQVPRRNDADNRLRHELPAVRVGNYTVSAIAQTLQPPCTNTATVGDRDSPRLEVATHDGRSSPSPPRSAHATEGFQARHRLPHAQRLSARVAGAHAPRKRGRNPGTSPRRARCAAASGSRRRPRRSGDLRAR